MKKFIAIGAMTLVMTPQSSFAAEAPSWTSEVVQTAPAATFSLQWVVEQKAKQTLLEKQAAEIQAAKLKEELRLQQLKLNTEAVYGVVARLTDRVGKTHYVFSGSTPKGWDCSGLVKWAYGEIGVVLEHQASKQQTAGEEVEIPKLGDIVVFKYNNRDTAYHVGIYLYPDTMIHAGGGKGDTTSIVSISKFAGKHTTVTYRRILETN